MMCVVDGLGVSLTTAADIHLTWSSDDFVVERKDHALVSAIIIGGLRVNCPTCAPPMYI